jgi:elongation factor 1 alpha-like protein
VVVVNKMDAVTWDQSRFEHVKTTLAPHLRHAGWKDNLVTWVPAAGREGVNLHVRIGVQEPGHPLAAWWPSQQHCVLSAAQASPRAPPPPPGPLRLPVWDILTTGGHDSGGGGHHSQLGALACGGRVESGALRVGQPVVLSPSGATSTIKALHIDGAPATLARAGDAVEVGLAPLTPPAHHGSGVAAPALLPGVVLCTCTHPAPAALVLTLRVRVLAPRVPLLKGTTVTCHLGAAREPATITSLVEELDARTGDVKRARPRCLPRGTAGVVEVTLGRPMAAERYDDCQALGRVALREGGATLALGVVIRVGTQQH